MTAQEVGAVPTENRTVAVVGLGSIGRGVVHAFAAAEFDVWAVTRQPQRDRMAEYFAHEAERGRLTDSERLALTRRITTVALDNLPAVDLVVEAIAEDERAKGELFRTLDQRQPARTILATSTSTIPISRIAAWTADPGRVIGMHYMSPVPVMELVEIIVGEQTSQETRRLAENYCRLTRKTPVAAGDRPGFVASRLAQALINEAAWILHDQVADAADIDKIARLGLNLPVGPLELLDLVGADVAERGLDSLRQRIGTPRYEASPVIRRLVAEGTYGRKTGSGIYRYPGSGRVDEPQSAA